ncbi:MAG: hypothetical protein AB8I08_06610 [Sandaracinaceae bacterium]
MKASKSGAGQGHAKGLLFNYLRDWAIDTHSQEAWERALDKTTPREKQLYESFVLASSWQPVDAWNTVVRAFFEQEYADPNEGMSVFCAHLGELELTTLVRLVLQIGSPEFMLKRTGFLWNRYFDTGTFGAEEQDRGHWRLWLDADTDVASAAGVLTCANGPGPWLQRGLALSGVGGTVQHVRCRFRGHPRCEFEAKFRR